MRRKRLLLAVAAVTLVAPSAAAAPSPVRVRVSPVPARLDIARAWNVGITVVRGRTAAAAAPRLVVEQRGKRLAVRVARTARRGVYRARVVFPLPGRWTYAVAVGGRTRARGSLTVQALRLPYDLDVDGAGRVYLVDGELGRIVRYDPAAGTTAVVARGFREASCIDVARDGTMYVTDIALGRLFRVSPSGTVETLAEIPTAAGVSIHPNGRTLAVAALSSAVFSVDVATGATRLLPVPVEAPHGLDYDTTGNLFISSAHALLRVDAATGAVATVVPMNTFKVHPAPDGGVYVVAGEQSGGRVLRIDGTGSVSVVAGNGELTPVGDGGPATAAGLGPTDVAFAPDGALLVAQATPFPGVRRVDLQTGVITTFLRG